MHKLHLAALLGTLILTPGAAFAQRLDELPRGARIRVGTADGSKAVGRIRKVTADAIDLDVSKRKSDGFVVHLNRDLVTSVEVNKKSTAAGVMEGGLLGLLVGGGGGFIIGALSYSESDCDILACSASQSGAILAFLGGVVGLPVGMIWGGSRASNAWKTVRP
jgi:hypothetical protein